MKDFNPEEYKIFECITGSVLYGTNTPESDVDKRGICLPPMEILIDPFMSFNVKDSFEGEDRAIYDLGKFFELCSQMNPNIVEMLFIPEDKVIFQSATWKYVLDHKKLFLSKKARHTFTGYSISQLKAIIRHREWFIDPPSHKPTRKEFGLSETPLVSEANIQNMMGVPNNLFKDEYYEELQNERRYRETKKKWDNYMQWQTNRNPKRKASEEKMGFDGKYASHLFRLMEEGKELLLTGNITFPLVNADWLLAIKNGEYTYEQILEMAWDTEKKFELWHEQSPLPKSPNINGLKELYFDIILRR